MSKKLKQLKVKYVDVKSAVLAGRKLGLMGVRECRKQFDCGNTEEHLQHVITSHCCDAPFVVHYSKGEIILLCANCASPGWRIQIASSIPYHIRNET